ncbi:MAG: type III pantothenate kinase [Flavobacteriales bacterium]|nr:type III pantothenate kinase [Flavobacteriales bacterium]
MNLVIDIGNTNVKLATFQSDSIVAKKVVEHSQLIQYLKTINFKKGIVSNVGNVELENKVLSAYSSIIQMSSTLKLPIQSSYLSMETIGNDRLANAVGAFVENPNSNSLIIDAGSCLTFDFIDSTNCYQGGAISTGLNMRFKALNAFTEKLPLLDTTSEKLQLVGNNTNSSIVAGVVNGMVGEIVNTIASYRSKYTSLTIFMTGGDTDFLQSIVGIEKNGIFALENLTLKGLNNILETNVS